MYMSITLWVTTLWPPPLMAPPASAATASLIVALDRCAASRQERICDSALTVIEHLTLPNPERQLLRGIAYFNKFVINEERFLEKPVSVIPPSDYTIERGYYMMQPAERQKLKELGKKSLDALEQAPKGDVSKGILSSLRDAPIEWE